MIKERQMVLEKYFSYILNDPFIRGNKTIKKFIRVCKLGNRNIRYLSNQKKKRVPSTTRSKSLSDQVSDMEINFKLKKFQK